MSDKEMQDSKNQPKGKEVFSVKRLMFWLVLLGLARVALQSIIKITNGEGEQIYRSVGAFDISYIQSGGFSSAILLAIAGYSIYKKFSA